VATWSYNDISDCYGSVSEQTWGAYMECTDDCEKVSMLSFVNIYKIFRYSNCMDDCNEKIIRPRLSNNGPSCVLSCFNKDANMAYGKEYAACKAENSTTPYQCAWNRYVKGADYSRLIDCKSSCWGTPVVGPVLLSDRDEGYVKCTQERLTLKLEEKKGFLYLPFESASGLKINTGWNYTKEENSCGNYTSKSFHGAVDLDKTDDSNVKIVAAASGNVTEVVKDCGECKTGYGAYVKMRSADPSTNISYVIVYGHMENDSIVVEKDQQLSAGDELGILGTTGDSTGTHLHFEVRKNEDYNQRVDPYDIQSIDECDYPGWSKSFEVAACGPNYLWTECPPVPR
jgi:hypothetical protein